VKCEMPGCRRELDPNDTYETDVPPDDKHKPRFRKVCGKCYKKLHGAATGQVGAGRQELTEGKTCKPVAVSQLALL